MLRIALRVSAIAATLLPAMVVAQELRHPSPSPYRFLSAMALLAGWAIHWGYRLSRRYR